LPHLTSVEEEEDHDDGRLVFKDRKHTSNEDWCQQDTAHYIESNEGWNAGRLQACHEPLHTTKVWDVDMELKSLFGPMRRWWWLLLAGTLIAGVSSYIATRDLPSIYLARATLIVGRTFEDPNPTGNELGLSRQLTSLYAEIARRQPIRDATKDALGLDKLPDYEVAAIPDTQLLEISVTDTIPVRAQAVANELANQLILGSPASAQQQEAERQIFIRQQLDYLQASIIGTQSQLAGLQARLADLESAVEISETQNQIEALETKLSTTQTTYASLLANTTEGATNTVSLIEAAALPMTPIGFSRNMLIALASFLGLMLSTGTAHLLELLNDAIQSPDDIHAISDLPTLATIERYEVGDGDDPLVVTSRPGSMAAHGFHVLASAVQFAARGKQNETILVTSAHPTAGKTAVASNLAATIAQNGHRVLLIDADLVNPNQHLLFAVENSKGLKSILDQAASAREWDYTEILQDEIVETEVQGLSLLPAGFHPGDDAAFVGGLASRIRYFLPQIQPYYDFIVMDSPPALSVADALALSVLTDGVLIILEAGQSRRTELREVLEQFNKVRANVMGIVLNRYGSRRRMPYGPYLQKLTRDRGMETIQAEPEQP
jgi:capsular exopolysaccharide synthesis family protein